MSKSRKEIVNRLCEIEEKYPVMDELGEEQVVRVTLNECDVNDTRLLLRECCDDYYEVVLTKEKCLQISNFFKELAESDIFEEQETEVKNFNQE